MSRGIPHVPSEPARQAVRAMVITGIPLTRIASALKMKITTLNRYYQAEIDESADRANTQVVANLHRIAIGKSPQAMAAAAFWCKTKMGWRETSRVEADIVDRKELIIYSGALAEHDRTI
jgi:mannose/fructose/N-acetylgalactosamine-specific phosphotransferase system component IIC